MRLFTPARMAATAKDLSVYLCRNRKIPLPFTFQLMHTSHPLPFRIAIFASGTGTNAQKIIDHFQNSTLARIALIVSNKPGAGVLTIAQRHGISTLLIERERFVRGDGYVPELQAAGIDLVVLAGFLWKVPQTMLDAYPKKIINIHPALLPKYGGKGMYGHYVHEAVLAAQDLETGITIHYVDEHYDHGDTIFQARCPVAAGADAAAISNSVQQLEHYHYPRVIEDVLKKMAGL
jgi:phosphoribosylglycinamide formyltransferase-1